MVITARHIPEHAIKQFLVAGMATDAGKQKGALVIKQDDNTRSTLAKPGSHRGGDRIGLEPLDFQRLEFAQVAQAFLLEVVARFYLSRQRIDLDLHEGSIVGCYCEQPVRLVLDRPAFGKTQAEVQGLVVETVCLDKAVVFTGSKSKAVQVLQKFCAGDAWFGGDSHLIGFCDHFLQTLVVVGMCGEYTMVGTCFAPFLACPLLFEQFLVFEHADDFQHGLRIVAGECQVLGAETIGFQLMFASVAA